MPLSMCNVVFEHFFYALYRLQCFQISNRQIAYHFVLPTDICAWPITLYPSGYERLSNSSPRDYGSATVTETAF